MELTLQSDELFQVMKVHMTTEQEQISTKFVVDFEPQGKARCDIEYLEQRIKCEKVQYYTFFTKTLYREY